MRIWQKSVSAVFSVALLGSVSLLAQKDFVPDTVFSGSTLAGWHALGDATWKAQDGKIAASGAAGEGWLVSDVKLQDVRVFLRLQCAAGCNSGVLLRASKTKDNGLHGVFVSLAEGDLATYDLTLDANGKEVSKVKLPDAPSESIGIGGPPPAANAAAGVLGAPPAGGAPRGAGGPAGAAAGRGGRGRPQATLAPAGSWNTVELLAEAGSVNGSLNDAGISGGTVSPDGFGTIAIFAGKGSDLHIERVGYKDINGEKSVIESTSTHFTKRRLNDFYYGWSAVAADINHNGSMDVVSGPFIYEAPDYTVRRLYREGRAYNPSKEYAPDMINFAYDFNGDGWPDILASDLEGGQRPIDLYINPKGEPRRWEKSRAVNGISTELVLFKDIDGDGKPEIIFGGGGIYSYAKPDPSNPSAPWLITHISGPDQRVNNHGMGVGDINGDGRMDLIVPSGWFEQPPPGQTGKPWTFHEANFGGGGGEMGIYDVNGDGLPDVVTSLAAHGFGLAWFEQKRDAQGNISFVRHDIEGDFSSTDNAGGVVFSQPHASAFADMDGDGIPDMVVGKSMYHHLELWGDPDPYGPAVLYVYRTVRDKSAPGGARFVPELIDNHSGVGSAIQIVDLNHDGAPDVVSQSVLGTFVFYGKKGKWPPPAAAAK